MSLIQLKAHRDSFYKVIELIRRIDIIVLCEGSTDAEVLKAIVSKLGYRLTNAAVTDCEGIKPLYNIVHAISALSRISRRLKSMIVIIDCEDRSVSERLNSLLDSVRSHGLNIREVVDVGKQTFSLEVAIDGRLINFIIAVNGVHDYMWFRSHKIEDHGVMLAILEGILDISGVGKYNDAKQVISGDRIVKLVRRAGENVRRSFSHIVAALEYLVKL